MSVRSIPTKGSLKGLSALVASGGRTYNDDVLLQFGTGDDAGITLKSLALAVDGEVGGVIVGTSDHPGAAIHSLLIGNTYADGDIMLAVQSGGNTTMSLLLDASAADLILHGLTTLNFDVTSTISTTAGDLILDPNSQSRTTKSFVVRSDSTGFVNGAGDDTLIKYDGTNLVINPKVVGSGFVDFAGDIGTSSGDLTLAPAQDIIFKQGGNEIGRFEPAYGGYTDAFRVVGITSSYNTEIHVQGLSGHDSSIVFYEAGAWKYIWGYDASEELLRLTTTDYNGAGGNRDVMRVEDGQAAVDFDVTIGSFDDYDDVAVLEAAYSPTAAAYDLGGGILKQGTELLADIGVLKRYKDGWLGYNPQRMDALIAGGIYQTRDRIKTLEERIVALEKGA